MAPSRLSLALSALLITPAVSLLNYLAIEILTNVAVFVVCVSRIKLIPRETGSRAKNKPSILILWMFIVCRVPNDRTCYDLTITSDSVQSRTLMGLQKVDDAMTEEMCVSFCSTAGYFYAGVEYSKECCEYQL